MDPGRENMRSGPVPLFRRDCLVRDHDLSTSISSSSTLLAELRAAEREFYPCAGEKSFVEISPLEVRLVNRKSLPRVPNRMTWLRRLAQNDWLSRHLSQSSLLGCVKTDLCTSIDSNRHSIHVFQYCRGAIQKNESFYSLHLGDLYTESRQILQGFISAVSKPDFASKSAF